jgi:hypothetical protein
LRKRWILSRENKERKDKVGNIFLPPAIRTLLFLKFFQGNDGLGQGKISEEKIK